MEKKNKSNVLLMVTLCLASFGIMADMLIIPAAGGIAAAFPAAGPGIMNYILTGPTLFMAIFSLLSGKFSQYISDKKLMIIGFGVLTVGAIFGAAIQNIYYLAFMRSLVGIGMGLLGVTAMAIISKTFVAESKRVAMIGIYNGAMSAIGAVMGLIGGFVAGLGWSYVFYLYLILIPIWIMMFFFVPNLKTKQKETDEANAGKDEEISWLKVSALNGAFFVFCMMHALVFYQIAILVLEKGVGDTVQSGIAASLGTVGGFVGCVTFGLSYSLFKRFTPFVGFLMMSLCYIMLMIASSFMVVAIASALIGVAFGLGMSYYMMQSTIIVPMSKVSLSIGISTSVSAMGAFLSTYATTFLQSILQVDTISGIIPIAIGVLVAGAVLSFGLGMKETKQQMAIKKAAAVSAVGQQCIEN